MIPSLVISSFLLSFAITPALTATFTSIRIPLSIAPIKDIPRPENKDAEVALPENVELYSKATIYDDLTLSTIYDLDRILSSTMSSVISNIFVLEERGLLNITKLSAYICTTWCFDLQISEITRVTGKTMENLKGEPNKITVLEIHNAIVQTLEDIYCFNMTEIEGRVGMSSKIVLESQWALFVPEIVKEAVQCRADILGVTVSELAELLRTNVSTLYAYTLHGLTNTFFPNFLLLQARKNVFETRTLLTAYAFAGLTEAQGEAETMLSFAGHSSIAFNLRDLEILYDWQKPQLFAIENVPLSSYFGQCSVVTSNSLLAVSTVLFGQGATEPSCNVAYVLSRSLNEVEAKYTAVTAVESRNSLNVFITATGISSWFDMDSILQTDIDEGIWVEIPSVSHVASAAGQTTQFIKTCSLPAVIASLKNSNVSGALAPFLEINNPSFRSLLLTTYGYSSNELISLTGQTLAQILSLPVVELHGIILDALVERYSISNLHVLFGEPGVDMRVLPTLPSFEWSKIVRAVIQGSFAHAADAVSVNVAAQGSHLVVTDQADGNPSIQISPTSVFFSPKISTSTLATCLLGRNESDIYELSATAYHQLYSGSIVPIVNGKITIESTPLETLLANDGLVLQQIWNRTVAEVIAEYTDLSVQQLGCLYGWNQGFLNLIDEITWGNVSAYRLCNDYETSTLHQILILLSTAQPKNCFGTISLTQSDYSVAESGGIVAVFVELVGGEVDSVVEVKLSVFPLTATLGTDFENKTEVTITFQANQVGQQPVVINIPDDGIVENDEQFLVVIQSLDADTRVEIASATVTIIDDDFVSISWQVADNTVEENVGLITPNLVLNGDIEKDITVSVVTNDLSTSPADYTLVTTSVTFTPSDVSNTKPVQILINNDNIVEGPETVVFQLSTTDTSVNTSSAVILIQDDDRIFVSFVQSTYSFNEATQAYQVNVMAVATQLAVSVQVGYSTFNSDAAAGLDYVNQNSVVTFSPFTGSQTSSISVMLIGDNLIENDETFTVELSVPAQSASLVTLDNPFETTVIIVDDDTPEFNFNSPSYAVSEGSAAVYVNVTLTGDIRRSVDIGYSTQTGTASASDFSVAAGTITFNPGESSERSIIIPITQDGFVEASEQFRVILLLRDAKSTIGSVGETTVTIIDDDKATVQFTQTGYTFEEDVGTALLGVRLLNLAGALQTNLNVSVTSAGTTATVNSDFTAPSTVLTFYAGDFDEIRNISLPIHDDNLFEIDETLFILLNPGSDQKVVVASPQSATVTITNNDVALISFTQNSYSVTEGQVVPVSVEVVAGTLGSNVAVSVATQGLTAENSDFTHAIISVPFQAGETGPKSVDFVTVQDNIVETTELVTVSLETSSGVSLGSSATVSILDDDDVIVQFTSSSTVVTEGSPTATVTITALGTKTIPITVSVSTQDQTATATNDYSPKTAEIVTFQAGDTLKNVEIAITDDNRIEEIESFQVVLTAVSSQVALGPNNINTVQIIDDDFATVQFTSELFSGNETFGYVDIWVSLTGVLEDPITVSVSTDQDTALAGIDYGSLTDYPVIFTPGGATLQYIRVNITDDLLIEGTERFTASISSDSSFTRIGSINETTVRIIDNDVASLGFSNALILSVVEGNSVILTVEVTGPLTTQVSATATVSLISASNADFNVISSTDFDFSPGNTNAPIVITTDNDVIIEGDEVFIVTLSTTSPNVRIDEQTTTVTIEDNDDALISLSHGSYQGSEDSPVVGIFIEVVGSLETVVQARLVLSPITAQSGDYAVLDDPIVIFDPSSPTTQRRNITIVDDNVVENLEIFRVDLQAVSDNVQITPRDSATISISDNDAAIVGFSPTTKAVVESAQSVNLTVQLFTSAPLQRTVPFSYSTINNTAKSPGDYDEITDGQLQFNIGDENGAVRVISIGVNDDVVIESTENFQVQLSASSDTTLASSRTATVTIIDNDVATIRLIETSVSVAEGAGQVTVQALLIGIVDREVTARLTSSDTTALQTLDYQPINQEITFTAGQPLTQVLVTIVQDDFIEGTETFDVTLTSTDANVQDSQSVLTVNIVDDDTLTIGFQTATLTVPENQVVATIPIILIGNRAVPVTFTLSSVGVSATTGVDYTFNQQDITVNPSDASTRIVTIPINNDQIVEGNEIFNVFITETSDLIVVNTAALAVTIEDDDSANIRFSQSTYSFAENIILATVQVEVDGDLETTVTARVTSASNSAESGVDFTSIVSQAVIFSPGDTSKPVNVIITSDDIVEVDEVFSLALSTGGSAQLAVGTPGTTFITIVDDDEATVEMSAPTYTYSEEVVTAQVQAKLNTQLAIARPLTFRIFTENGTAYSPRDFTHLNQIGEFGSGFGDGDTVSFSIAISDDSVVENTEHFFVQLAEVDPALQLVNLNRSTVFIQDNDAFEARFVNGDRSVNEEDNSVRVSVQLIGEHEREVTIRLVTTPVSATAGLDYEPQGVNLLFSPGESLEAVDITILDDLVIEGTETFQVTISTDDAQVRILDPATIVVSIIDTDVATVSFNQTEYRVSEDVGSSAMWVELKNDLQINSEVNVQVYNFPDTAVSPADYAFPSFSTILTFRGGQTKLLPIYFNVVDDDNVENEESFYGLINAAATGVQAVEPLIVKVYIDDNDVALVGFTSALYTVDEGNNAVVGIELDNSLAISVTVSIKTTAGSASSNVDFSGITRQDITFNAGETTKQVVIPTVQDSVVENDEIFTVSLETSHVRVQFGLDEATVRIDDDDAVIIAFQQPQYIVSEDDGSVQITYPIVGTTAVPLNYVVHIDQGSARLPSDYLGTSQSLTIQQGTTQNTVTVQLVDDENIETNETFSLRMDNLNDDRIVLGNPSTTTVLILDDDAATVEFAQPQYNVLEDGVSVTVMLNLTGILDQNTTVRVSSYDGSATAGADYTAISSHEITFTPGGPTEYDIVILIADDGLLEGTESFVLTVSSQNVNTRIGENKNTTVRIIDDDVVSVDFVQTTDNVPEQSGVVIVNLEISGTHTVPVTVSVESVNINALAGSDYTAVSTSVTFQPSESIKPVTVFITNDVLIENDEQFLLRLSTDDNQVVINDDQIIITITDNDVAAIRFEQSTYTVDEDDGDVTLGILLNGNLGITVTANVQFSAQTAVVSDYIPPQTTTVVFPAGSNRAEITVNITDDNFVEATETFLAELQAPASKVILGSPDETTVFIRDNDAAQVRFLTGARNVNEDVGVMNMTIVLTTGNPLQRDVSVRFSTLEDTAKPPGDYSSVGGTNVIFNTGDTNGATRQGMVSINDDQIVEATETFSVVLTEIDSGLTPTTFSSATIGIIDDDSAILAFVQSTYSVNEQDTSVDLLVVLTGTITRTVTARISTANIDAIGGNDYASIVIQQITFNPGDPTIQTVSVTISDDTIVENNERFTAVLSAENGVTIRPDAQTATVTIVDNDVVTVTLEGSQIDVTEGNTDAIVLVKVTGERQRDIHVNVSTYDVSAFATVDYEAKTEIVTLVPSSVQQPFLAGILDDNIVENTEQFGIRVTSTDPQVNVQNGNLLVSIRDNDKITLSMGNSAYEVDEDDGVVIVEVVVTGQTTVDIAGSSLATTALTAQTPADFGSVGRTILVQPTSTTFSFPITIQDDGIIESSEIFRAILSTTNSDQVIIGTPTFSTITIRDDDALLISFEQELYIVSEDDGTITVGVVVTGSTAITNLQFGVTAQAGSATSPADYVLLTSSVGLTPGVTRHLISVRITDNENLENNETFSLHLNNGGDTRVQVGGLGETTILILDDDAATIQFTQALYSFDEFNTTAQVVLNIVGVLGGPATVSVFSRDNSAIAGIDYDRVNGVQVTFTPGGPTSQALSINITNDVILEGTESFHLDLVSSISNIKIGDIGTTTVRIIDDDSVSVEFVETSASISESGVILQVQVEITGQRSVPVTARVQSNNLLATAGEDYGAVDQTITFQPSDTQPMSLFVTITQDEKIEVDESFVLTLSTNTDGVTLGDRTFTITIQDDDVASIRFEESQYQVNESVSSFRIGVLLLGDNSIAIDASVALSPETAVQGEYLLVDGDVTFDPGENRKEIVVFIVDDNIVEQTETFKATLSAVGSKAVVVSPDETRIFVQDNDVSQVRFQTNGYSVNEDDQMVNLTVVLVTAQPLGRDAFVSISTQDGTAVSTNNVDYDDVVGSLITFRQGDGNGATQWISIPVIDDSRTELSETFTASLSAVNTGGLEPVNPSTATVTIVDNDNAIIRFAPTTYTVVESTGSVSVTIVRIGTIERPVSAFLTLQPVTAAIDDDFTNVATTVTFNVLDTSKTQIISITNDVITEETETFTATLTPTSGAVVPDDGKTATITIIDEDVLTIVMEADPSAVPENAGSVTVTVKAIGGLQRTINLNVFTFDISASTGDYVTKNEVITLDSANTERDFVVSILNDSIVENAETFGVNVTTDESQVLIQDETITITILDEDRLSLSIDEASYTVQEDAGFVSVDVTVTGVTSVFVSGSVLSTRDGTARQPLDYQSVSQNLLIAPGDTNKNVVIPVSNDTLTEGLETFNVDLTTTNTNQITIVRNSALVLIQDDDVATVQFLTNQYYVNESSSSVEVTVILTGNLGQNLLVRLDTAQDSAIAGLDYDQLVNRELTFSPGNPIISVPIIIRDDILIEGSEDFSASLSLSSPLANIGAIGTTTITILDDDVAGVGFNLSSLVVEEDEGTVQIAVDSTGNLNTPVTVSITVTQTTTSSNDYTVADGISLTFVPNGATRQFFDFTPVDDDRVENDEIVLATLSTTDLHAVILTGVIQITIQDNDKAVVRLGSSVTKSEGDGFASIEVLLTGNLDVPVTVNLETQQLTAMAGSDFVTFNQPVVFQPGDNEETRQVVIIDDDVVEPVEFMNVVLTSTDGKVTVGNPATTSVIINDNDGASLFFNSENYFTSETDGNAVLTVVLATNAPIQRAVTASFILAAGTAVSPEDFPATTTATVTFNIGDDNLDTRTVTIPVVDDDIVEPLQSFQVTIVSTDNVVNPGTTTVHIADNDVVSVRFTDNAFYFDEDEDVTNVKVAILFTSPLQNSITIGLMSQDNSATAIEDYTPLIANNTIVISPADGAEKLVPVSIVNDVLYEEEENFRLTLSSDDPTVTVTTPSVTNVFIVDDDDAQVGFQRAVYWTTEDSGAVQICVVTSTILRDDIIVTASTSGIGSALPGLDYAIVNQQLNLTSTTPVCFNVQLLEDLLIEGNETFSLQLVTTNPRVQITQRVTVVHIVDDDVNECTDRTHDCHANAFCSDTDDSFTCTCLPGFAGDGRICVDIDECLLNTHNCHNNATCANTVGSYECTCKPGYSGDGINICVDLLECDPNPNSYPCHRFSTCIDTMGSYVCFCPAGFVGDGYNFCNDTNECVLGTHDCVSFAACQNTRGTYTCQCPAGFFGDGRTCVDILECEIGTDNCHDNATCTNTAGSYDCTCNLGFTGNGRVCDDINECENLPCDANADCSNSVGFFKCVCKTGFTGNGFSCQNINECDNNPCAANAECEDNPGSYDCECNVGFTGDGHNLCTDVNECALDMDNCHVNASCNNIDGSFECRCWPGFTGNGVLCQNINECQDSPCHQSATCYDTVGSFRCKCNDGFVGNGTYCADKIDCIPTSFDWPCHQKATCQDIPGSFICACHVGYTGDGFNCVDIDECARGTHNCGVNATCENVPGTYTCDCSDGFIADGPRCIDFNECEGPNPCNATTSDCTNLEGGHRCVCKTGFQQDAPDQNCYDTNECNGVNQCDTNADCFNTFGSYRCTCKSGFSGDGFSCIDIQECNELDPCHANADCRNNIGSFTCTCMDGFSGDGINNCEDIDECPEGCHALASCQNAPGTFTCNCNAGYSGDGISSCEDINECEDPNTCPGGTCTNSVGNFSCTCGEGYDLQGNVCVDRNECLQADICPDNSECKNHPGSFNCECDTGYGGPTCTDIDECAEDSDECSDRANCTNNVGSYTCQCLQGYSGDGRTCDDINECRMPGGSHNCDGNATCVNEPSTFSCRCNQGYVGNGQQCEDIKECQDDNAHDCSANGLCIEVAGTFDCVCKPGFSGDGRVCEDIKECDTNPCDANAICTELPGTFQCDCRAGYTGNGSVCEDIRECDTNPCDPNANCTELRGSYQCVCRTGYSGNGSQCEDIDECLQPGSCDSNADCTNTVGSFMCTCRSGFTGDGKTCQDIKECEANNPCHANATCTEEVGDFSCECKPGYTGNGTYCQNINECDQPNTCHSDATCLDLPGTFRCTCNGGFIGNGQSCTDILECTVMNPCHTDATCTEQPGSYSCACKLGFTGNGTHCQDIDECDQQNVCHTDATCEDMLGSYVCTCKDGYSGDGQTCTDINECERNTDNCHANAQCSNRTGSFDCVCKSGYTGNGTFCSDIDECAISADNSCHRNADCGNTVGSFTCTCKNGFTGTGTSCADINECNLTPNPCLVEGTTCENLYGSHRCNCPRGQNYDADGVCKDVLIFNLQFIIQNVTFSDALLIDTTEEHLELKAQLEKSVNDVYSKSEIAKHYIKLARLQWFSQGPGNTVRANFSIFIYDSVRNMTMADVQTIFFSNLTLRNSQSRVLEPNFLLSSADISAGDYDECSWSPSVCDADELCQNYPGTYRCYCSSPAQLNINDVCTNVITFQSGFLILNLDFVDELNNPNSLLFLQLAEEIQVQLNRIFQSIYQDSFQGTQVIDMNPGSVNISFLIFFKPGTNVTRNGQSLTNLFRLSLDPGNKVGIYQLDPATISQTDYNECGPSSLVHLQDCDKNANCTNVVSTYKCTCKEGYYGDGSTCTAIPFMQDPDPPKDDLWWLVYAIVFGIAFLVICMFILFVCCLENAEENRYMVENTTLVNDRNKYFFHNESVGIVNPDIELASRNGTKDIYTTSPVPSRMESYKVNPMFHETRSHAEQSSLAEKSSISNGQEGYIAL